MGKVNSCISIRAGQQVQTVEQAEPRGQLLGLQGVAGAAGAPGRSPPQPINQLSLVIPKSVKYCTLLPHLFQSPLLVSYPEQTNHALNE